MPDELDPATYGLTIWDLDREFLTGGVGRHREDEARRPARRAARRLLPHHRHRVHAHPGHRRAALDPVEGRGRPPRRSTRTHKRRILERLNAAEAFEKFLATKYVGTKRFGLEGAESAIPILDEVLSAAADDGLDSCVLGMAHRGPAQRARQRDGQELRPDLQGVRGPRRPVVGAGLRRRQVPPRRDRQVRQPDGRRHPPRAGRQPEPPRDRRPGGDRHGPRRPGPDRPAGVVPVAADPASTATRRSPARASSPRCLAMSDISGYRVGGTDPPHHQQPDRLHDRARVRPLVASTAATSPRPCRRRSSTSTATTPRRASAWPSWPSSTASGSTRTSSSTWCATAATGTTRATTRATPSR